MIIFFVVTVTLVISVNITFVKVKVKLSIRIIRVTLVINKKIKVIALKMFFLSFLARQIKTSIVVWIKIVLVYRRVGELILIFENEDLIIEGTVCSIIQIENHFIITWKSLVSKRVEMRKRDPKNFIDVFPIKQIH